MVMVDGKEIECDGTSEINLTVQDIHIKVKVIALSLVINGFDMIMLIRQHISMLSGCGRGGCASKG